MGKVIVAVLMSTASYVCMAGLIGRFLTFLMPGSTPEPLDIFLFTTINAATAAPLLYSSRPLVS